MVTHFVREDNHDLASSHCVPFLWLLRSVTGADKAQAMSLHDVGVKTSPIMDLMSRQCGGPEIVGFIRKDCTTFFKLSVESLRDGDAEGALGYFSKAVEDFFFFSISMMSMRRTGWINCSGLIQGLKWTMQHLVMCWPPTQPIGQMHTTSCLSF